MKAPIHLPALLLMLGMALGGCARLQSVAGPAYVSPATALPAQWSTDIPPSGAVQPGHGLPQWWRQWGDPTLDQLIDTALSNSTDLRLAQARLRQARATLNQAGGSRYPSISASASASRTHTADQISNAATRTLYDAGFDASWEIDVFGGVRLGIEAARADLAASQANLDQARVTLVAEVARNYVDWRAYRQRIAIARANLASQDETLQITRWRNQAGLASGSDVEQARTSREQTRAGIPDLEVALAEAENRLAILLGTPPGSLQARLDKGADSASWPPLPAGIAIGIPADVLRQRPDLIAAERTLTAETARTGQKRVARYPSLDLGASFGWQAYSLGALGGSGSLVRALSGTLAATLFDGGKLRSAVEIQEAAQEQALVNYESSVLTALEEVENALKAFAAGQARVDARLAAVDAARSAARMARDLYQAGLGDFQQVLETERTRLSAEDGLAAAEASLRTSLITLYKSLGGGWERAAQKTNPQDTNPQEPS